ncbi:hypothetical protein HRI_000444500 [Hibiscus trionum]|uniref:RNase H type-1 domain-containing protein n=1 Tax=Hibiscus trionum TaxID=183268 RepID=A0A9W7GZ77_HIBTR|nr:hypothetical protein HRI_000444500 [Hibiscus trionum]
MCELWAAYEALKHVWNFGCLLVDFETDNSTVADMLNGKKDVMCGHNLVNRIKELMERDWDLSIRYVLRVTNMVADKMASLAFDWSFSGKTWLCPPGSGGFGFRR